MIEAGKEAMMKRWGMWTVLRCGVKVKPPSQHFARLRRTRTPDRQMS